MYTNELDRKVSSFLSSHALVFSLQTFYFFRTIDVVLSGANERRLLNDLMAQYNTLERPVYNESEPLIVSFGLTLQQIIDIVSHSFLSILHPSPIRKFPSSSHHLPFCPFLHFLHNTCSLFPSIFSPNVLMHPSFFRTVFPARILPFDCFSCKSLLQVQYVQVHLVSYDL